MLFYMIKGANVTFRHFLFMYPPLVFMAVYALGRLCNHKRIGQIVKGGLAFQAAVCVVLIIVGHPFQTTYFNILAGKNVAENFQYINTDYYKEALEQILKLDSGNNILVSSDNLNCYYGIKQAWEILSPKKRIEFRSQNQKLKHVITRIIMYMDILHWLKKIWRQNKELQELFFVNQRKNLTQN